MPTINQILETLSDEQLEALKQELIKAQATGGEIKPPPGTPAMTPPASKGVLPKPAEAFLAGARGFGRGVVSSVREMAGMSPLDKPADPNQIYKELALFKIKKQMEDEMETEKMKELLGTGKDSKFKPKGFTAGGVNFERELTEEEKETAKKEKLETSPILEKVKQERTEKLITSIEENKVKKDMIEQAKEAATKIDTGLMGRGSMWWKKNFAPNDPMLAEWQKVKMVLTDAQLMNTAKTKGAISDREMDLFARAAANDDIASVQAMKPVFDKLLRFIDADEKSTINSFKQIYGKDLFKSLGIPEISTKDNIQPTPEEATAELKRRGKL